MNFRKSKKNKNPHNNQIIEGNLLYEDYVSGKQLKDVEQVKKLIKFVIDEKNVDKRSEIFKIFERYLTFSKYICSYFSHSETDVAFKKDLFSWFKKTILNLPDHSNHALLNIFSLDKNFNNAVVKEILQNKKIAPNIDSFIFREGILFSRKILSKDDLDELVNNIVNKDIWTKRAIAYCVWRGKQFNQKEKRHTLMRIMTNDNSNDVFLKFFSKVTFSEFKNTNPENI